MTGFREQGSGIPLMLLHGISSGAASAQADGAERFSRAGVGHARLWRKPDAGRGTGERGITPMRWRRCLTGLACAVLVGHSLGALVASAFAAKYPDRAASGAGGRRARLRPAAPEQREQVWRSREQQMALGGEILAQTRAAKLLRPGAREEDIATVAAGMRRLRPEGYLAAAWMLAHDDIHGWLKRYSGNFEVWCGEQDAITQPELVQGLALRYGMPFIAIARADMPAISITTRFNQQLLRINEEVRDECTN